MKPDEFKFKLGDIVMTPTSVGIIFDVLVSQRTGDITVLVLTVKNVFKEQVADAFTGKMIAHIKQAWGLDIDREFYIRSENVDRDCGSAAGLARYAAREYGEQ
jgi:hypothetical protein